MPPDAPRLIAILRGVTPQQAASVGDTLFAAGIRAIEVPLNSPDPFASIRALSERFGESCLCGAGTVLTPYDVQRTLDAGGRLIVSPNCDSQVIAAALQRDMLALPGIATATEAFSAIRAGARHLKLFPAATYGARHLKALRDVLPADVGVYPVGGVGADDIGPWLAAGATGFGFGSELFKPELSLEEIAQRAQRVMDRWRAATAENA